MMKRRRKLIFLLIAIGVPVAVALGVMVLVPAILRKGYRSGGEPEAIAYNYLMALVRRDYARAHGYLSPTLPQYPATVEEFLGDLERHQLLPAYELRPCVYIESMEVDTDGAEIELRMQYYDPCFRGGFDFRNLSFNQVRMRLERIGDGWKIVDSGGFYYEGWSHFGE